MTTEDDFLVFGQPVLHEEEINEVLDTLRSGWIGTGPKVTRFEDDFAAYKEAPHAVAVSSCTAALHLSLISADIGPGDEVITTPLTFCATANAILHAGATPVLADVDPKTMNIDPEGLKETITDRTAGILPVHFAGRPCKMNPIVDACQDHDLTLIEDCAHAIETQRNGEHAGTFGEYGCFSFYATKNVATAEGGMILTKTEEAAEDLRRLALHGMSRDAWKRYGTDGYKHYHVVEPGYKYNMTDIQAALGIHQLARVDDNWERREMVWGAYNDALKDTPLTLPPEPEPGTRHAYHLYTVLVDEDAAGITRDAFLTAMTEQGVGVGVHYVALPEHPYYQKNLGWEPEDFPHATRIGRQTVSLPLTPGMGDDDVGTVIDAVQEKLGS